MLEALGGGLNQNWVSLGIFVSFLFVFSFGEKCLHLEVSIKEKEEQFFKIPMGVCI